MKKMRALTPMTLAATLCCSTMAFAQSSVPNIDVTAQRFHENAPVAVTGTVSGKEGNNLILSLSDGEVLAKIAEPMDNLGRYSRTWSRDATVASQIPLGDNVTVYGHLRKSSGMPEVIADAVAENGSLILTDTGDHNFADLQLPARLHYQFLG